MNSSSSQVRVAVRIRPLSVTEKAQGGQCVLETDSVQRTVGLEHRKYTYDAVYDSQVAQSELYHQIRGSVNESEDHPAGLLQAFLEGYNATILAYGQTGSGKTFTMGSEATTQPCTSTPCPDFSEAQGLIPRFMMDIFSNLHMRQTQEMSNSVGATLVQYEVRASFLEVYGEEIHDLLQDDESDAADTKSTSLPLREDGNGGVIVVGLKCHTVNNASEALQVLQRGTLNRTTAATLMNHTSSRSHAVFTIYLYQTVRDPGTNHQTTSIGHNSLDVTIHSRFTFVDLAGSERMKKTGAEGDRAREGIEINKGLLALGNVINALADDERLAKGEKVHVPYRQSKLTRLLQDALGGNSQTLFLACVSPSDTNASETISTLQYANRARNIKNVPTKNVDATLVELQRIQTLNHILQWELIKLKFDLASTENWNGESVGNIPMDVLQRKDVQDYLCTIMDTVSMIPSFQVGVERRSRPMAPSNMIPTNCIGNSFSNTNVVPTIGLKPGGIRAISTLDMDEALMDVNPVEDMALLDKLIELQHQDQEYDNEQRQDLNKIDEVRGQIEEKESLLQQLKENLKIYHNMKEKYDLLMVEVQSLEAEKTRLATELNHALMDPTKGCSKSIQKKLEMVESNLTKARLETKKHQDMYRKAEQEAQRCHELEQKITLLKHDHVSLMKKQREAASRHREFVDAKKREIEVLKRNERKTVYKVTKLEAEIHKHKANLIKRNNYCEKLSEKLKETEHRLMKLLSTKKQERPGNAKSMTQKIDSQPMGDMTEMDTPMIDDIASLNVLVQNLVSDQGEELESTHKQLLSAINELSHCQERLRKSETRVAELEDKLVLMNVGMAKSSSEESKHTICLIEELWTDMDTKPEERDEVRNRIARCLEDTCLRELANVTSQHNSMKISLDSKTHELRMIYSALGLDEAVSHVIFQEVSSTSKQHFPSGVEHSTLDVPKMSLVERLASVDSIISNILPRYDAAIQRRTKLAAELEELVLTLNLSIENLTDNLKMLQETRKYNRRRLCKREKMRFSKNPSPHLNSSKEKRGRILKEVEEMIKAIDTTTMEKDEQGSYGGQVFEKIGGEHECVSDSHHEPSCSLSDEFLDGCERDLNVLITLKAQAHNSNSSLRNVAHQIAMDMHIRPHELISLVEASINMRMKEVPHWWKHEVVDDVCRSIISKEPVVRVNDTYTLHLTVIVEALKRFSDQRKSLSNILKQLVGEAQKKLLATVEAEVKGHEAYCNFQGALNRLPSSSKEHVRACIDELSNLANTVDSMSQSEIEALMVLWEGLNVGPKQRGVFWGRVEEKTMINHPDVSETESPLADLLHSYEDDTEAWILESTNEAILSYKSLHAKLLKFSVVHSEVEKLRSLQDLKSVILMLNSDILSVYAEMTEFENKSSDKQRLTLNRPNSSALLEEEKSRRRIETKLSTKLRNLHTILHDWERIDGEAFNRLMLSDEVRELLYNHDRGMEGLENKTEQNHLKTVKHSIRNKHTAVRDERGIDENMKGIHTSFSRSTEQSPLRPRPKSAQKIDGQYRPNKNLVSPVEANTLKRRPINTTILNTSKNTTISDESKMKGRASVIHPFGDILSKSPTSKENIRTQGYAL